ncbi:MAG TPA: CDP-alcohol phosphatidyltransferase family protein [Solirubrobacteraceae bacterium]|nr:CDP-alcohol phosphatidyltransferase family protein [Solirubrobacteraceae bacterium]
MAGASLSPTGKRLFGIDRSGPPPEATLAGAPLHPWTLPNLIGYGRLAGIPAFLVVALSSTGGHSVAAAVIYGVVGWSDYLDGFTARLTGQYSRLGALLDPVIDRLLVLSGMAVCWRFDLLPRWALALVIARELFVLLLSRYGLRRGVELEINWFGRLGVAPTMGAPFFALLGLHTVALVMLYCGLALALAATVLYVRRGLLQLGQGKVSS